LVLKCVVFPKTVLFRLCSHASEIHFTSYLFLMKPKKVKNHCIAEVYQDNGLSECLMFFVSFSL